MYFKYNFSEGGYYISLMKLWVFVETTVAYIQSVKLFSGLAFIKILLWGTSESYDQRFTPLSAFPSDTR